MSDFLKRSLNQQNMSIEKALQTDTSVDATFEVVTVTRNSDLAPLPGAGVPNGTSRYDGKEELTTGGTYAVIVNLADVSEFANDIHSYEVISGELVVVGHNTTWTEFTFLVF